MRKCAAFWYQVFKSIFNPYYQTKLEFFLSTSKNQFPITAKNKQIASQLAAPRLSMAIRFLGLRNLILSTRYRAGHANVSPPMPFVGLSNWIWNASKRVWIKRVLHYDAVKVHRIFWRYLHSGEFKVDRLRGFLTASFEDSRHSDVDSGDVFSDRLQLPLQRCFHTIARRVHVLPFLFPVTSLPQCRGLEYCSREFYNTRSCATDASRNRNSVSTFLDFCHPACSELANGGVFSTDVGWVFGNLKNFLLKLISLLYINVDLKKLKSKFQQNVPGCWKLAGGRTTRSSRHSAWCFLRHRFSIWARACSTAWIYSGRT